MTNARSTIIDSILQVVGALAVLAGLALLIGPLWPPAMMPPGPLGEVLRGATVAEAVIVMLTGIPAIALGVLIRILDDIRAQGAGRAASRLAAEAPPLTLDRPVGNNAETDLPREPALSWRPKSQEVRLN